MPYIKKEDRTNFDKWLASAEFAPDTAGELNYVISCICRDYLIAKGQNYSNMNEIIGVLECAKIEMYRRIMMPYEDKKINENGDIYS